MYCRYQDITDKLGEPKWWDEEGVPRYCDFSPDNVADIYADKAVLVIIKCQGCGRYLPVAWSFNKLKIVCWVPEHPKGHECFAQLTYPTKDNSGSVGYGDAPAHDNREGEYCHLGCVMTTDVVQIKEFWSSDKLEWKRHKKFEFTYLG